MPQLGFCLFLPWIWQKDPYFSTGERLHCLPAFVIAWHRSTGFSSTFGEGWLMASTYPLDGDGRYPSIPKGSKLSDRYGHGENQTKESHHHFSGIQVLTSPN